MLRGWPNTATSHVLLLRALTFKNRLKGYISSSGILAPVPQAQLPSHNLALELGAGLAACLPAIMPSFKSLKSGLLNRTKSARLREMRYLAA